MDNDMLSKIVTFMNTELDLINMPDPTEEDLEIMTMGGFLIGSYLESIGRTLIAVARNNSVTRQVVDFMNKVFINLGCTSRVSYNTGRYSIIKRLRSGESTESILKEWEDINDINTPDWWKEFYAKTVEDMDNTKDTGIQPIFFDVGGKGEIRH